MLLYEEGKSCTIFRTHVVKLLVSMVKEVCSWPLLILEAYWPFGKKAPLDDADKEAARQYPYHSETDNFARTPWSGPGVCDAPADFGSDTPISGDS